MRIILAVVIVLVEFQVSVVNGSQTQNQKRLHIWPMPKQVTHGNNTALVIPKDFHLTTKYGDVSGILKDAFARLITVINLPHSDTNIPSNVSHSFLLQGLNVVVSSNDEQVYISVFSYVVFYKFFFSFVN